MKSAGLPPLIGGFADKRILWKPLEGVDYEQLGCLLSCHLIIEHYLDHYLQAPPGRRLAWSDARLSFSQKIALISNVPAFKDLNNFVPTLKHLNRLRNKFSHDIHARLTQEDVLPLKQFTDRVVFSRPRNAEMTDDDFSTYEEFSRDRAQEHMETSSEQQVLVRYTNFICAFFGGSVSMSAELFGDAL